MRNNESKYETNDVKKWESKISRKDLKYETKNSLIIFSNMKQYDLLVIIFISTKLLWMKMKQIKSIFNKLERIQSKIEQKKDRDKKRNTFERINALYERRELILIAFRSGVFPIKGTKDKGLKNSYTNATRVTDSTCRSKSR